MEVCGLDLDSLHELSVSLAEETDAGVVLERIVRGLGTCPDIALARVWLIAPGDICDGCRMRDTCLDQSACLHLMASFGTPYQAPPERWNGRAGHYRRVPLDETRRVGRIAVRRQGERAELAGNPEGLHEPGWIENEGLVSFAGQPLVFRGAAWGVLAIFARRFLSEQEMHLLRVFADHAASAIANARAFEEIERLRKQLAEENAYLREEVQQAREAGGIIGSSEAMARVLRQITLVAATESAVLIEGESGTGKELAAQAIHEQSTRAAQPLVRVNCAAVPHELFESEFFGHVKGAFTGAVRDRKGRFELADGGTLFLDEVGEIPLELQGKLLRVLQEGTFERIGEEKTRRTNVRILAATNRDLMAEADAGRFRQDLYYRLSVFPIHMPPLRERPEDVPELTEHFLKRAGHRLGVRPQRLDAANIRKLQAYPWPGNIRELQNAVERAVIISRGSDTLCFNLPQAAPTANALAPGTDTGSPAPGESRVYSDLELRQFERDNLVRALEACHWKVSGKDGAAARLGIKANTFSARMKTYKIERPRERGKRAGAPGVGGYEG